MTDNQFNQLFDLVTKTVNGIQRIEKDVATLKEDMSEVKVDVSELKADVSELKEGQKRIEKEMRLNNQSVNQIAGEQVRMNNRITDLERASV